MYFLRLKGKKKLITLIILLSTVIPFEKGPTFPVGKRKIWSEFHQFIKVNSTFKLVFHNVKMFKSLQLFTKPGYDSIEAIIVPNGNYCQYLTATKYTIDVLGEFDGKNGLWFVPRLTQG